MSSKFRRLTDHQWEVIKPFLQYNKPRKLFLREVVDAIRRVNRTGMQWRDLEENYPKWQSVYYYHRNKVAWQWAEDGTTKLIMSTLSSMERVDCDRQATPSLIAVDSQSIKAAPFVSEDRGIDGNKKINAAWNGRKRHIAVDTMGLPFAVHVGAADRHDGEAGLELLHEMDGLGLERLDLIRGDSAYGGVFKDGAVWYDWEVDTIQALPTEKGFVPQKNRWQVERGFAWLNGYRRLSKDYEKKSSSAEAFIALAFADMILARFD